MGVVMRGLAFAVAVGVAAVLVPSPAAHGNGVGVLGVVTGGELQAAGARYVQSVQFAEIESAVASLQSDIAVTIVIAEEQEAAAAEAARQAAAREAEARTAVAAPAASAPPTQAASGGGHQITQDQFTALGICEQSGNDHPFYGRYSIIDGSSGGKSLAEQQAMVQDIYNRHGASAWDGCAYTLGG